MSEKNLDKKLMSKYERAELDEEVIDLVKKLDRKKELKSHGQR